MTRHSRRPLPADFFSPLPRRRKGKEKAVEPLSVDCCLPTPVSCVARHSLWCPIRNRLFMMNQIIPRRSHSLPHPPQRCPRRHASSAARILSPQTRSLDRSESVRLPQDPEELSSRFRSTPTPLDPEHAWDMDANLEQVTPREQFQFFQRLFNALETWSDTTPDLKLLHTWGMRLDPVLHRLKSKLEVGSPEFITIRCYTAQLHAWLGDVAQASEIAREIQETSLSVAERRTLLCVYRNILVILRHRHGASHALDLLVREWKFLDVPFSEAVSFHETIHSLLADISDGASLLLSRSKMDKGYRTCMGKLLLEAYCAKTLLRKAHALVLEMRRQQLPVNSSLQIKLTRLLARHKLFDLAHEIFTPIRPPINPRLYYSTGLYLYACRGDIDRAEQFFREHDSSMPFARCMLMHVYAIAGRAETVVELFHKFFPATSRGVFVAERPEVMHYSTVILAYAELANFDGINLWLEKMLKAGYLPDGHVYSIVLQSFARRGDVNAVAATRDQMRAAGVKFDRVHYTNIITFFAWRKDAASAEAFYLQALREGIMPDRIMITSLMNAHVEAGSWEGVVRIFDYLRQSSSFRDDLPIEVYNTLLKAYVLIGTPFRVVHAIFRKLTRIGVRPDGYTYALTIQSACDAGKMDAAEELFADMEEEARSWGPLYSLDAYVLTIIMAGHVRQRSKDQAKACYEEMHRRGIKPNSVTYRQILQAYANDRTEESLEIAESFLKEIIDADAEDESSLIGPESRSSALGNIFSPLMLVYARKDKPEKVARLFNGMLDAGGEPSLESLSVVLDVHRRTYKIDVVRQLWPQIWTLALRLSHANELFEDDDAATAFYIKRRSNRLCLPLSIYIDALSAAGEHQAVLDVWTRAKAEGFSFDAHNWNHLAVALVRAGELDRAFEVLERVLIPCSRKSPVMRDPCPESPLVFDVSTPEMDTPASDAPMRRNTRRAIAVKVATKTVDPMLAISEESTDFAHPLHILHQIIPGLSMWRPHTVTLQVLSKVLRHLQGGHLVQPVPVRASNAPSTTPPHCDDSQSQVETANATLQRIYHNYPEAVRAVLLYERRQARREAAGRSRNDWGNEKQAVDIILAEGGTIGSHES